jgi:hypothetical protein
MRKIQTWLIILAAIVTMAGAMLLWIVLQPDPGPPRASVTLLGYTNDANGVRLARFAITNLSLSPMYRASRYHILIPLRQYWESESMGYFSTQRVLGTSASETLTVPVPTNQPTWRIWIMVYTDPGHTAVSGSGKAAALLRAMLTPGYRVNWYSIQSGPVADEH